MRQALYFMLFAASFLTGAYVIDYAPEVTALMLPVMIFAFRRGELWEAKK